MLAEHNLKVKKKLHCKLEYEHSGNICRLANNGLIKIWQVSII